MNNPTKTYWPNVPIPQGLTDEELERERQEVYQRIERERERVHARLEQHQQYMDERDD